MPVATRLTVDSCNPSLPATARWVSGRSSETPAAEEAVLALDDLGRDLEDGARPLLEAAHQPAGAGAALRDEGAGGGVAAAHAGGVDVVHQHARQGLGVELHRPAAVGRPADVHVRHRALHRVAREAQARLRVERAQLGQHVGDVLGVDAAARLQLAQPPARRQREVVEHRLHRRVEPVALAELQRQALPEVARADARRDRRPAPAAAPPARRRRGAGAGSPPRPAAPAGSRPPRARRRGSAPPRSRPAGARMAPICACRWS